ncbi:MAG: hypothetical protein AMJ79_13170 [Phycisphaerae bacterium SM23_30]|nr:MAG: hypothetical protein AMJ79_13170 [Phycisphaerae bacterium SM23_30]
MEKTKLIQIGESLHASIAPTGAAMRELSAKGERAYEEPSDTLNYIISLITSQIQNGADYMAVNVDRFGEDIPRMAADLMREYVNLVKKHSQKVPVCLDSSDDNALKAGLEEWYKEPSAGLAAPLINSVKPYTVDNILPLRKEYPFKVIGLLVDDKKTDAGGVHSVDQLYAMALKIFTAAAVQYGFKPEDLFFDTTVFPLAIDMPMTPHLPGYTYRTFEAVRRIMNDPNMKGVHTVLGISNCAKDLPGRKVGICRAYLAVAQRYGLDAAIVDVKHQYGQKPAAAELLQLVEAFARQDGSEAANQQAVKLMTEFCRTHRKLKTRA